MLIPVAHKVIIGLQILRQSTSRPFHFLQNRSSIKTLILNTTQPLLTLNLLTTTIVAPPSNASKWQMGLNSAFKGLNK